MKRIKHSCPAHNASDFITLDSKKLAPRHNWNGWSRCFGGSGPWLHLRPMESRLTSQHTLNKVCPFFFVFFISLFCIFAGLIWYLLNVGHNPAEVGLNDGKSSVSPHCGRSIQHRLDPCNKFKKDIMASAERLVLFSMAKHIDCPKQPRSVQQWIWRRSRAFQLKKNTLLSLGCPIRRCIQLVLISLHRFRATHHTNINPISMYFMPISVLTSSNINANKSIIFAFVCQTQGWTTFILRILMKAAQKEKNTRGYAWRFYRLVCMLIRYCKTPVRKWQRHSPWRAASASLQVQRFLTFAPNFKLEKHMQRLPTISSASRAGEGFRGVF